MKSGGGGLGSLQNRWERMPPRSGRQPSRQVSGPSAAAASCTRTYTLGWSSEFFDPDIRYRLPLAAARIVYEKWNFSLFVPVHASTHVCGGCETQQEALAT